MPSDFPGDEWPTFDRPSPTQFDMWRRHVDTRLDKQDKTLAEQGAILRDIRDAIGASKMGLAALKGIVGLGVGIAAILAAISNWPHK